MKTPALVIVFAGSFLAPFAISVTLTALIRGVARWRGYLDRPGAHKAHAEPVALGGGVAVFVAICVPVVGALIVASLGPAILPAALRGEGGVIRAADMLGGVRAKTPAAVAILAGALVLHVLGLIDDRRALRAVPKLVVMGIVALGLTGLVGLRSLELLGAVPATILTAMWIVVITNAFNFLDNMDGLSGGVALIAAGVLAAASLLAGQLFVPALCLVLMGAVGGFLVFNFPPASIFMGDSGSLVIGYFLAVLTVMTTYANPAEQFRPFGVLSPAIVLAVPLYDVGSVLVSRWRRGASLLVGDRRHFSHRLVRRGLSPRASVLTIYLATAATGCTALLLPHLSWPLAIAACAQCVCIVLIVAVLESTGGRAPAERP
jgi:UDP-GlcNAc:undecaprenyl-phosphate GlcNAc-1-phosphate transferase